MASGLIIRHDCVILDACCVINLHVSGAMEDILQHMRCSSMVAAYVHDEELARYDLAEVVRRRLLAIVDLQDDNERLAFVNYAAAIGDDGEAATGAIAMWRKWAIATDDRKAISVFTSEASHLQLVSTPELVKNWVETAQPSSAIVQDVLKNIEVRGHYKPHRLHVLRQWWDSMLRPQSNDQGIPNI